METKSRQDNNSTFDVNDGSLLISSAREAIQVFLSNRTMEVPLALRLNSRFSVKTGCFVTLKNNDPEKTLRGCIGFPEPVMPLSNALIQAAVAAAVEDPRFEPVTKRELDNLLLEISILTRPNQINVKKKIDLPKEITVGKDGLILKWAFGSGLLLPQVAREYDWDAEEFLCNLSMKAGAPPDEWLNPESIVYKFQAIIFGEETAGGRIVTISEE